MERINSKQFETFYQQIDDIEFFQGDSITIPFQFVGYNNEVIKLRKSNSSKTYVKWQLCPYGQFQSPLIELQSSTSNPSVGSVAIDTAKNIVYVTLSNSMTDSLVLGKYVQQVTLCYDFEDGNPVKEFRRAQGFIIFKQKIGSLS